jgi:Protein of unknown function (DUF732)
MCAAETHMDLDRITNPLRLAKVLVGAVGAVIAIGLAAPAGASPVIPQPQAVPDFLAAARAAGITGTDPAMLEDGYSVCRRLWIRHMDASNIAAGLVQDHPQLTWDQAGQFVLAAYHGLCPVPGGTYDYWAYSTS